MEAKRLSYKEADLFQYYLEELPQVTKAVVYERTADAVICYQGERSTLLKKVAAYRCKDVKVPDGILEHSGRELNSQYQEKLVNPLRKKSISAGTDRRSLHRFLLNQIHLEGNSDTCKRQDRSSGTGWNSHRSFCTAW